MKSGGLKRCTLITLLLSLLLLGNLSLARAGTDTTGSWKPTLPISYRFLAMQSDTITGSTLMYPVFSKLSRIQTSEKGVLRIVHIGDSHTQADMMTGVVRRGLQTAFGNAGRGLIFPYQVAGTNSPVDIFSSSPNRWSSNRLAIKKPIVCGVSGFGIHCESPRPTLDIGVRDDSEWDNRFDRVRLFLDNSEGCYQLLLRDGTMMSGLTRIGADTPSITFKFREQVEAFSLSPCASNSTDGQMSFYGVSLEKQFASGILYHSIGVNGAMFSQYNSTALFWKQLPALHADCYVLSLGTNEAQAKTLNREAFISDCRETIRKLRKISPNAVIVITTPAGSHTRTGKANAVLQQVNDMLHLLSLEEGLPLWDLYGITGGFRMAPQWKNAGLMSKDGIHYNKAGYALQGNLLLIALARAYSHFLLSK